MAQHQAPAPERTIAKGLATPSLHAQVLIAKYCDHTPLYRQSQIFARHGVSLDRSTLAGWVGGACWWLEALQERIAAHILESSKLFADDTPVPVLDPGRGRTKTGRLWVYVRDDRPWLGPDPPAALYRFSPDRKGERPASHMAGFAGVLQVDGYQGFERLTEDGTIVLAACWAHTRRKFYDVFEATASPIAAQALERIGKLYEIEEAIRAKSADGGGINAGLYLGKILPFLPVRRSNDVGLKEAHRSMPIDSAVEKDPHGSFVLAIQNGEALREIVVVFIFLGTVMHVPGRFIHQRAKAALRRKSIDVTEVGFDLLPVAFREGNYGLADCLDVALFGAEIDRTQEVKLSEILLKQIIWRLPQETAQQVGAAH